MRASGSSTQLEGTLSGFLGQQSIKFVPVVRKNALCHEYSPFGQHLLFRRCEQAKSTYVLEELPAIGRTCDQ